MHAVGDKVEARNFVVRLIRRFAAKLRRHREYPNYIKGGSTGKKQHRHLLAANRSNDTHPAFPAAWIRSALFLKNLYCTCQAADKTAL